MLQTFESAETRDKPYIIFDPLNNHFEIRGNSLPEDTTLFYQPVIEWIIEYAKDPNQVTHLVCSLDYFNSSSAKMLYELFIELEKIKDTGKEVKVTWGYDPDDHLIEEKGLEFKSILEIPFEVLEK
ncbi:MAG: DUF1987 domain-containing protein [Bacteroidales bacterium]|jgi:hypothetical protein|nr:DUF1987 domain-containing protein [Bacteroidales bacterium]